MEAQYPREVNAIDPDQGQGHTSRVRVTDKSQLLCATDLGQWKTPRSMSHRKSYSIPGQVHFLTFSCFQRRPFLLEQSPCRILAQSLDEARAIEHFDIWAYVFMPEHVHLLIRPTHDVYDMAAILRRIKEPVSRRVLGLWRQSTPDRLVEAADTTAGPVSHRFWQPGGGFDRNIFDPDTIRKAIDYVEWNPVRRRLVTDPLGWEWSSARARAGGTHVPFIVDPVTWEPSSDEGIVRGTH